MFSQVQSIPLSSAFTPPALSFRRTGSTSSNHSSENSTEDKKFVTSTISSKRRNNESLLSRSFGGSVSDFTALRQNSEPTSITYSGYLLKRSNEPFVPPEHLGSSLHNEVGPTSAPILIGAKPIEPESAEFEPDHASHTNNSYFGGGGQTNLPNQTSYMSQNGLEFGTHQTDQLLVDTLLPNNNNHIVSAEKIDEKEMYTKSAMELAAAFFGIDTSDSDDEDYFGEDPVPQSSIVTAYDTPSNDYQISTLSAVSRPTAQHIENAYYAEGKTQTLPYPMMYHSNQQSYLPTYLPPGPIPHDKISQNTFYHRVESAPVQHSHNDIEEAETHPADIIDPDDGHIWRAKYCILENGILYFYRNSNDAHSPEAKSERDQLSLFDNHIPNHNKVHVPNYNNNRNFHDADLLAHSPMPRKPFMGTERSIGAMHESNGSHPYWEKRVALDKVGTVRSAQFEYGDFSFILIAIDCDDNPNSLNCEASQESGHQPDRLILRASSTDEMNEWLFQIHRSLVPFMKKIVNLAKSNNGIMAPPRNDGAYHRKIPSNEPFQYYKPSVPIQMPMNAKPLSINKNAGISPEISSDLSLSHGHGRSGFHRRKLKDRSTPASTPGGGSSPTASHGWGQGDGQTGTSHNETFIGDSKKSDTSKKHAISSANATASVKLPPVKKDIILSGIGKELISTKTIHELEDQTKGTVMEKDSVEHHKTPSSRPSNQVDRPLVNAEKPRPTGKYVPPHLRKNAGKYIPPHLRNRAPSEKSENKLASFQTDSEKKSAEQSDSLPKVNNFTGKNQKDATFGGQKSSHISHLGGFRFNEGDEDYISKKSSIVKESDKKNDFGTSGVTKLGGCADPSIVVGSILDAMYRSRKAPKVGKVHSLPYGYNTSRSQPKKQFQKSSDNSNGENHNLSKHRINWEVGAISECGIRDSNEDSFLILNDLISVLINYDHKDLSTGSQEYSAEVFEQKLGKLFPDITTFGLFAIFDGHLGNQAARFAAEKLPHFMKKAIYSMNHDTSLQKKEIAEIIVSEALIDLDTYFCRLCLEDGRDWECGATALVSLVVDDAIVVAHLGDSSGVLCAASKSNTVQTPNDDHIEILDFQNHLKETGWSVLDPDENDSSEHQSSTVNLDRDFSAEMSSNQPTNDIFWKEIVEIHSPDREDERKRIESANGWITTETEIPISQLQRMDLFDNDVVDILKRCFSDRFNVDHGSKKGHAEPGRLLKIFRICGELAVSRSLGDRDFKAASNIPIDNPNRYDDSNPVSWEGPLFLDYADDHSRQFVGDIVSPLPETQIFQINVSGFFDEFLLLACDGLWDVMDADDAVRVTRNLLFEKGWDARKAAARLAELAIHLGSSDNITVIVIHFRRENI